MMRLLLTTICLIMSTAPSGCRSPAGPAARVPVGDAGALARGRAVFQAHCALCHGAAGDGRGARHAGFKHPPPDFTNEAWRDGATPAHVLEVVTHGVHGTAMAAWAGSLTAAERQDVAAYVLSLAAADGPAAGDTGS